MIDCQGRPSWDGAIDFRSHDPRPSLTSDSSGLHILHPPCPLACEPRLLPHCRPYFRLGHQPRLRPLFERPHQYLHPSASLAIMMCLSKGIRLMHNLRSIPQEREINGQCPECLNRRVSDLPNVDERQPLILNVVQVIAFNHSPSSERCQRPSPMSIANAHRLLS